MEDGLRVEPSTPRSLDPSAQIATPLARAQNNLTALEALVKLRSGERSPKLLEALAAYGGWGGSADTFSPYLKETSSYLPIQNRLKELLTDEEYASARASVLTAYYTPSSIIQAMYHALAESGLGRGSTSATVLEPGCGTGNFMRCVPQDMNLNFSGIEIDELSSDIARYLVPSANIVTASFENVYLPHNSFDAVVGNVPFSKDITLVDPELNSSLAIHDWTILNSLRAVRPGGVVSVITSRYTLDKADSSVRKMLAEQADLVGCVRLPSSTFSKQASTDVITDVLVLKKLSEPRTLTQENMPLWVYTNNKMGFDVNNFVFDNQDEVCLGSNIVPVSGRFGDTLGLLPQKSVSQKEEDVALRVENTLKSQFTKNGFIDFNNNLGAALEDPVIAACPVDTEPGRIFMDEAGMLWFGENEFVAPLVLRKKSNYSRAQHLIRLRDGVEKLLNKERDKDISEDEINADIKNLNELYESFVHKYGEINSPENKRIFSGINDYTLCDIYSLENVDNDKVIGKSDVLKKRVIVPAAPLPDHVDKPIDALNISLDREGKVDALLIARLLGIEATNEAVLNVFAGQVFQDPATNELVLADEYLSGDVVTKLEVVNDRLKALTKTSFERAQEAWIKELGIAEDVIVKVDVPQNTYNGAMWRFNRKLTGREAYLDKAKENGILASLQGSVNSNISVNVCARSMDIGVSCSSLFLSDFLDLIKNIKEPLGKDPAAAEYFRIVLKDLARFRAGVDWMQDPPYAVGTFKEESFFNLLYEIALLPSDKYPHEELDKIIGDTFGIDHINLENWSIFEDLLSEEDKEAFTTKGFTIDILHRNIDKLEFLVYKEKELYRRRMTTNSAIHAEDLSSWFAKDVYARFKAQKESWIKDRTAKSDLMLSGDSSKIERLKHMHERLLEVQPAALSAESISIGLGNPWIPPYVIRRFCEEVLFDSGKEWDYPKNMRNFSVVYDELNGRWQVYKPKGLNELVSEETYVKYGLSDYNGWSPIDILSATLNNSLITVSDKNPTTGKSIPNEEATMQAHDKSEALRKAFHEWVYENEAIKNELCDIYNKRFNRRVGRTYSGDYLQLEGQNIDIRLRDYQKDAVARILQSQEGTLVGHVVGAGKTFTCATAVHEAKRIGKATKPLIVVPNHLTGQWAQDFKTLYPGAKVIAMSAMDQSAEGARLFWKRVAAGDWDAVIVGHSRFSRLGLSREKKEEYLQKRIDEFSRGIEEAKALKEDFSVKSLEASRKRMLSKLDKLRKEDSLMGVSFDKLGVDMLVVDEAHAFKNLAVNSPVAGMSGTESAKCEDLLDKCNYLRDLGKGSNIVFATGTPVSNTMAELYNMQRYLAPSLLKAQGHMAFSAWTHTFGQLTQDVEVTPEGNGFQRKIRFGKFCNLPELMQNVHAFAGIRTKDMLSLDVPHVNFETVAVPATHEQELCVQELGYRADKVRARQVSPKQDNMLAITTDGKKVALDPKLLDPDVEALEPQENGKVQKCAENVFSIWEDTHNERAAQIVFCDSSTPASGKWNIYDDLKRRLLDMGIPKNEIAFIHDATNETKRDALFKKVREGEVRVLVGSTQKLGTGTNVQDRLIATHDLDCPWRPSDLEQRLGRMERHGNKYSEVNCYRYVSTGTFDSYLYQTVERKARFISQVWSSKNPAREVDDLDDVVLNYGEIKALAAGDPAIAAFLNAENELKQLKLLKQSHAHEVESAQNKLTKQIEPRIKIVEQKLHLLRKDNELYKNLLSQVESNTKLGAEKEKRTNISKELKEKVLKLPLGDIGSVGEYLGMEVVAQRRLAQNLSGGALNYSENYYGLKLKGADNSCIHWTYEHVSNAVNVNVLSALDKLIKRDCEELPRLEEELQNLNSRKAGLDKIIYSPFDKEDELLAKQKVVDDYKKGSKSSVGIGDEKAQEEQQAEQDITPAEDREVVDTETLTNQNTEEQSPVPITKNNSSLWDLIPSEVINCVDENLEHDENFDRNKRFILDLIAYSIKYDLFSLTSGVHIDTWYQKSFPDDDMGADLIHKPFSEFDDDCRYLLEELGDSVVRQRLSAAYDFTRATRKWAKFTGRVDTSALVFSTSSFIDFLENGVFDGLFLERYGLLPQEVAEPRFGVLFENPVCRCLKILTDQWEDFPFYASINQARNNEVDTSISFPTTTAAEVMAAAHAAMQSQSSQAHVQKMSM